MNTSKVPVGFLWVGLGGNEASALLEAAYCNSKSGSELPVTKSLQRSGQSGIPQLERSPTEQAVLLIWRPTATRLALIFKQPKLKRRRRNSKPTIRNATRNVRK